MQQVFDNDFYGKTDPDGKPVWDDDIEIDEILPDTAPVQEEINFEPGGDAYDPLAPGGKKLSKKMKRLAKAEKKRGVVQNMEPEKEEGPDHTEEVDDLEGLSPEERKRKLLEAMDEYHKLDCEDMIPILITADTKGDLISYKLNDPFGDSPRLDQVHKFDCCPTKTGGLCLSLDISDKKNKDAKSLLTERYK
ncbi:hypothetical protein PGTUg99_025683 [Puccinia graminis f. sp. tritici]|uniref:Uncharacterized protein n=1 Tax=Puccinia graminis f. sp. tritici TaxID=56615 RepID=A0A5B0QRW0_PUCGR|nr:hypothetical protein PGTUg99_025683 [Puccinia graminis f. sp. tritici]